MIRKNVVRLTLAAAILLSLLGYLSGGSSQAGTQCQRLKVGGYLCVSIPADGIEVFRTSDPGFHHVTGVGIECFQGHYFLQYQLGAPETYRPVPIGSLGTACPLFS